MYTSHTKREGALSLGFMYSESLALGLLVYAELHPSFKDALSLHVYPNEHQMVEPRVPRSLPLLVPQDEKTAQKRATWILQHGSKEAVEILQETVKDRPYESPKAVVLGITLGVWPIGVMGHDKPGKKVTVVSTHTQTGAESLVESGVRSSLTLLEKTVHDAGGNLSKVDPDMTDWFFGEKKVEFFKAPLSVMKELENELSKLDIPHATISDEFGPITMAISPAINPETLSLDWDLEDIPA